MAVRVALISPVSHLELVEYSDNIAMALSHLVLENKDYAEYYAELANNGWFIILDNSAFELEQQGKGLDPKPVLEAAQMCNASEVICTDVLCNKNETIQSTFHFLDEYYKIWPGGSKWSPENNRNIGPKLMAVVQGNNPEEWWEHYNVIVSTDEIDTIGLSKISVPHSFLGTRKESGAVTRSRLKVCSMINENVNLNPIVRHKTIHLLGGDDWSPYELSIQSQYNFVRSNDTSMPIWYGANGIDINHQGKAKKFLFKKPDLENKDKSTEKNIAAAYNDILHNIVEFHRWSKVFPRL